jgi:hypothetical protein
VTDTFTRKELYAARGETAPNGKASSTERSCAVCGKPVTSAAAKAKYCSASCRNRRPRSGARSTPASVKRTATTKVTAVELERPDVRHRLGAADVLALMLDAEATVTVVVDGLKLRASR